jgi:predicted RNase H-related nuclease YkuK (DUF458 family)
MNVYWRRYMLDVFHSPSGSSFSLEEVVQEILGFMGSDPGDAYRVIIGSDSQGYRNGSAPLTTSGSTLLTRGGSILAGDTDFVSVVVVHRVGKGGRYFWVKNRVARMLGLREKIYEEATRSLMLAMKLGGELKEKLGSGETSLPADPSYTLEIHVDIGTRGPTRDMIREIVGMIRGNGFVVRTKPEAYAASTVADRYT